MKTQTAPQVHKPYLQITQRMNNIGDCSFFKGPVTNTIPDCALNIVEIYEKIIGHKYEFKTDWLRSITDPIKAREFKARNFDYICASGIFSQRGDKWLLKHSNMLTIDYDHVKDPALLIKALVANELFETVLAFISPGGQGVKWIVKININSYSHLQWFTAIQNYSLKTFGLEIDKSGKDISRCCFLPHDPNAYINKKFIL